MTSLPSRYLFIHDPSNVTSNEETFLQDFLEIVKVVSSIVKNLCSILSFLNMNNLHSGNNFVMKMKIS